MGVLRWATKKTRPPCLPNFPPNPPWFTVELVLRRKSQKKVMIFKTSPWLCPPKSDFVYPVVPWLCACMDKLLIFWEKSEQFCLKIRRSTLICSNIHHRSQKIGRIRIEIGRIWTKKNSQSRTTKIELILLCEVVFYQWERSVPPSPSVLLFFICFYLCVEMSVVHLCLHCRDIIVE